MSSTDKPCCQLTLRCPHCQAQGMVPWNRLKADRRLYCRRCDRWYRLSGKAELLPAAPPTKQLDQQVALAVRNSFSGWSEYERDPRFGRRSFRDPQIWRDAARALVVWLLAVRIITSVAVVSTVLLLAGSLGWLVLRSTPVLAETPREPVTLDQRVPLFAEAWAVNDFATMQQFALPEETGQVGGWVIKQVRPAALMDMEPGAVTATFTVARQMDEHRAEVVVRVAPKSAAPVEAGVCEQRQVWRERDGKWFFSPADSAVKKL